VIVLRNGAELSWTIADLYAEAWKNPLAHNSLQPGDLILRVEAPSDRKRSSFLQTSDKHAFDWASVSCAAAGNIVDTKVRDARIALGSIAPIPYEAPAANEFLEGKELTDEIASQAADLVLRGAKPLASNGYKMPIAHALIRRTLLKLKGAA
jgi:xanthine dehydrogenase YagS FAD-binding subunit